LLHDAAEAYVGDLPYPLKLYLRSINQLAFDEIEDQIHEAIFTEHGLEYPMTKDVKEADRNMLLVEAPALLGKLQPGWSMPPGPKPEVTLKFWSPEAARTMFLNRYHELTSITSDEIVWDASRARAAKAVQDFYSEGRNE
jgi:hypothetical protein